MSWERSMLLGIFGVLVGIAFACWAGDALMSERIAAGTFEFGGDAYHIALVGK